MMSGPGVCYPCFRSAFLWVMVGSCVPLVASAIFRDVERSVIGYRLWVMGYRLWVLGQAKRRPRAVRLLRLAKRQSRAIGYRMGVEGMLGMEFC